MPAPTRHARPDASMSQLVRAGRCVYLWGDFKRAVPLLEQAIAFDWRKGRLWSDRHTVEWSFMALLEERALAGDWPEFDAIWGRALERCQELGMSFPFMHPHQDRLLDLCMEAHQVQYLPTLVQRVEPRDSHLPEQTAVRLEKAKSLILRSHK